MNLVDLFVFFVLAIFVLIGMYKGFVRSCMNVASYLVTFVVTLIIYPLASKLMFLNSGLVKNFRFYAEGTEKLANLEMSGVAVSSLSGEQISQIVRESVAKAAGGLRAPMDRAVLSNMNGLKFEGSFTTVGEYFNETIVHYGINLLCFILVFFIVKIILNIILSMYDNSESIPTLRQYDTVCGGAIGLIEGVLIFFILFSIIPLVYNIMTIKPIEEMLSSSMMGNLFIRGNIIPRIIRSVV